MSDSVKQVSDRARAERIRMLRGFLDRLGRIAPTGKDRFAVGPALGVFDRIYGGQSLAEAMIAAGRTVEPGRMVNSTHCYFLRLGDPAQPISYVVERLRDTRNFSLRQVRAEQADRSIIIASFCFAVPGTGFTHQWPMPEAPKPEAIVSRDVDLLTRYQNNLPSNAGVPWPIDIRQVDHRPWDRETTDGRNRIWMRVDEPIDDDPLLQASVLLFASDLTMADAVTGQHPIVWEDLIAAKGFFGASLDHSFWLHAPVRVDQWLLHVQESPRASGGRGFTTGRFFDQSGNLVASVAQEIFIKQTVGAAP